MSIEIEGIEEINGEVRDILNSLRNIRTLYDRIGEDLQAVADESIREQKSATTNQGFAALTDATQQLLQKPPRPALRPVRIRMVYQGGNDAFVASDMPYDAVHQFGNPDNTLFGHKAPIRARSFLPVKKNNEFTVRFMNTIEQTTQEWLDEQIQNR